MNSEVLKALSKDDLVALILAQQVQIAAQAVQIGALTARIAELEARLDAPRKTPGNSSTPPSKGQKPNRPESLLHNRLRKRRDDVFWCVSALTALAKHDSIAALPRHGSSDGAPFSHTGTTSGFPASG